MVSGEEYGRLEAYPTARTASTAMCRADARLGLASIQAEDAVAGSLSYRDDLLAEILSRLGCRPLLNQLENAH